MDVLNQIRKFLIILRNIGPMTGVGKSRIENLLLSLIECLTVTYQLQRSYRAELDEGMFLYGEFERI
jgi:hypothetical protein